MVELDGFECFLGDAFGAAEDGGWTRDAALPDDVVREGPRQMLAPALEAELCSCIAEFADKRDKSGQRLVVRDGHQ
ncbi:hypothetical protein [Streptomyces sp. NPDC051001]|uniref:hypothetical protein n=1 Tax=Streptomyces sp. NPDC051001 TaxID=3155795 RepID=UPI00342E1F58